MKFNMIYATLGPESQVALTQVFGGAPIPIDLEKLFSPILFTLKPVTLTPQDHARQFQFRIAGFEFPYSASAGQSVLVMKLVSPDLEAYYAELQERFGGVRSYFATVVDYPYIVVGPGSDFSVIQRGWIANTSSTLNRSNAIYMLGNVAVTSENM